MLFKLIEGKNGKYSSKRFVFVASSIAGIIGFFYCIFELSDKSPQLIPTILNSFLVYCAFIGGFVSLEMIKGIVDIYFDKKLKKKNGKLD